MIEFLGYVMLAFLAFLACFMVWAFWQKLVRNRPDRYGKGPGHDLRGAERGQWHRSD